MRMEVARSTNWPSSLANINHSILYSTSSATTEIFLYHAESLADCKRLCGRWIESVSRTESKQRIQIGNTRVQIRDHIRPNLRR